MKHIKSFFEYIFKSEIEKFDKSKCINFQSAFLGLSSIFIGVLGFLASKFFWLIWIAITLAILCIIVYFGSNYIVGKIEENEKRLQEKYKELEEMQNICEYEKQYWQRLYTETVLLTTAIQTANKNKKVKELYTKLANSIAEMVSFSSKIPCKNNYLVNIYMFDVRKKLVNRVAVQSYVHTFAEPQLTQPKIISTAEMKRKYYVKALKSNRTYFVLPNNDYIRKHLCFDCLDDNIISQYTQYIGMSYTVGEKVKLYVEVISFNEQLLDKEEALEKYLSKVIAPFASLITNINWNTMMEGI